MSQEEVHVYSLAFDDVEIGGAAMDLLTIQPQNGHRVMLMELYVENVDGTDGAGDAEEQFGRYAIVRGHGTVGSGGAAVTPRNVDPDGPAAQFTARRNDSTIANGGSPVSLHLASFPVRQGIIYRPLKLARIRARPDDTTLVVRLLEALTTPINCSMTCYVAEYLRAGFNVRERT